MTKVYVVKYHMITGECYESRVFGESRMGAMKTVQIRNEGTQWIGFQATKPDGTFGPAVTVRLSNLDRITVDEVKA